ncbi:MAG: ParB/RepB/Spo0J family partition protein [Lentihominibacter sp.]|nr:ParB/RepB/Spo0J family partition protein [Lentihominibacter sp.]
MPKEKKPKFELNSVDDIFTTQEIRDERKLPRIRELPIREIADFPDHPYKVKDDEDMMNLVESIRENGVLTPVTVRELPGGKLEMISGHRRKRACELLGLHTIRGEVVKMDRDNAIIMMCDSNLQRTTILPSEKAFAYKMRLEAMKRQGERTDLTLSPVGTKLRSDAALAADVGESRNQIQRYIRLTELIPEILEMVDEGQIAMRPAVEISYFPKKHQKSLLMNMEREACTPSHDQTIRMRRLLNEEKLTPESIAAIMQEEKPNQKEKVVLKSTRVVSLFPKDLPVTQREDYVVKAMEHYNRYLKRQREMDMER